MTPCANCDHWHASLFCPACGEKRRKPGIRLTEVVHEFYGSITHVEGPFIRTLVSFVRAPERLTKAYIAGKRKAFVPPVRYFLVGVGYYFLLRYLFNWNPVDSAMDSFGAERAVETGAMRVNHWMSKNINLLLPVLLIILSSFDRVLFRRTTLSWTERFVHYLFATGTFMLLSSTLIPLYVIWPAMQIVTFVITFGTLIWACVRMHGGGIWTTIKAVPMVLLGFILYVAICSILIAFLLGVPLHELVFQKRS